MSDLEFWIALSMVPEVGNITLKKLIAAFGSPRAVFNAPLEELSSINGVNGSKAKNIKNFSGWKDVEKQIAALRQNNARSVTLNDSEYPAMLRQTEDAPAILYVKGTIIEEDRFAIAVV